jgi:hypothetical protein
MEIIIFIAVIVGAALLWNGYVKAKKADSDQSLTNGYLDKPWSWAKIQSNTPWHLESQRMIDADKPWPYGEKLPEGKIHVKTTDVSGSENRVETPAKPTVADVTAENKAKAVAKVKKAPAKKTAAKPAAAKKAPAKKKST